MTFDKLGTTLPLGYFKFAVAVNQWTISPAKKRHRSSAHENVDVALYKWFKEKRNQNIPISGPILMAKSKEFATRLGDHH
jgi:hypothetical protein